MSVDQVVELSNASFEHSVQMQKWEKIIHNHGFFLAACRGSEIHSSLYFYSFSKRAMPLLLTYNAGRYIMSERWLNIPRSLSLSCLKPISDINPTAEEELHQFQYCYRTDVMVNLYVRHTGR